jgi:hypothetical protein
MKCPDLNIQSSAFFPDSLSEHIFLPEKSLNPASSIPLRKEKFQPILWIRFLVAGVPYP